MMFFKLYDKINYIRIFNTKTSKTIIYEGNIDDVILEEITEKLESSNWALTKLKGKLKSKEK